LHQLVIAVLSIALTALVVTGGASYMSSDWGRRRFTADLANLSYQSFDAALTAYRASNGGSLPPTPGSEPSGLSRNAMPWPVLRPYLGARADADSRVVSLAPVPGMEWYYLADSSGGILCLASVGGEGLPPVPASVRAGLRNSADRASLAYVGRACLDRDDSALTGDGPFAVTWRVSTGA